MKEYKKILKETTGYFFIILLLLRISKYIYYYHHTININIFFYDIIYSFIHFF